MDTPSLAPDTGATTTEERLASLRCLVGNTPLLEIRARVGTRPLRIYAKHETANFTGSVKDRMALHMLRCAHDSGAIADGDTIAEATSGNTGIAFAAIGRALGHPVRIFMPDWMSRERTAVLRSYGADIVTVSAEEGGFLGSIDQADAFAASRDDVFRPQQFESELNVAAHELSTGPELLTQMRSVGEEPAAFVAGVGTGGTVMGTGRYLRAQLGEVAIHPLEPADSPTLRTGHKIGSHRIEGISDAFVPPIVDLVELDEIIDVRDGDAILMAQALARGLGLGVGISSGANFVGAVQVALERGDGRAVATVFPDSHKKYLSTDLCGEEPVRDDDLAPRIELLGCRVVPRTT